MKTALQKNARSYRTSLIAVVASAAFGLTACAIPGDSGGSGESVSVVVSSAYPEANADNQAMIAYGDAVEAASDGRISFDYHFGGSLHSIADTADALADGIANLSGFLPLSDSSPARFPVANWASSLPLLATPTQPTGYFAFGSAQTDWSYQQDALTDELEAAGVKAIANPAAHPQYDLICTSPVTSLEEARGKRVRVAGGVWVKQVEALGMVPVSLSGAEVYEGLQRGVIDCATGNPDYFQSSSFAEVAKNFTSIPLAGYNQYYLAFGLDFWNSLNPDDQQVLWDNLDAFYEAFYDGRGEAYFKFFENAAAAGVRFHQSQPDLLAALDVNRDATIVSLADSAPDAVEDPSASVDQLAALNKKWYDRIVAVGFAENNGYQAWMKQEQQDGKPELRLWLDMLRDEVIYPAR